MTIIFSVTLIIASCFLFVDLNSQEIQLYRSASIEFLSQVAYALVIVSSTSSRKSEKNDTSSGILSHQIRANSNMASGQSNTLEIDD